ncbi:hypothetical protein FACS1894211_06010 [Clostridia bacterium]|nr:hypothetical protein FACS1894211_06010 [Clostridia bacterium]
MIKIRQDFDGGNIEVVEIDGDRVTLRQELRDNSSWWFYWAFAAEGLPKEPVTFRFDNGETVSPFGPAVSLDGVRWRWLGAESAPDRKTFTYANTRGHGRVYFSFCLNYRPVNFGFFLQKYGLQGSLFRLAVSEKGADIPLLEIGNPDAERHILLAARHHACESPGSSVLEGFLEYVLAGTGALSRGYRFHAIPFADYDGVIAGDQGKLRAPHDHYCDYGNGSIYASVRAVKALAEKYKGAIVAALDFHAPNRWGGENDEPFLVKAENDADGAALFSRILCEECSAGYEVGAIPFSGRRDVEYMTEWNTWGDSSFSGYMHEVAGAPLSVTLETPYFGAPDTFTMTEDGLRGLGRRCAAAVERYLIQRAFFFEQVGQRVSIKRKPPD